MPSSSKLAPEYARPPAASASSWPAAGPSRTCSAPPCSPSTTVNPTVLVAELTFHPQFVRSRAQDHPLSGTDPVSSQVVVTMRAIESALTTRARNRRCYGFVALLIFNRLQAYRNFTEPSVDMCGLLVRHAFGRRSGSEKCPRVHDPESPCVSSVYLLSCPLRFADTRAYVDNASRLIGAQSAVEPGALARL